LIFPTFLINVQGALNVKQESWEYQRLGALLSDHANGLYVSLFFNIILFEQKIKLY